MKDQTLYVVTGFMRTGTSMMMHALETGGLDAAYRQSRDKVKDHFADEFYDPNVGGLYELERKDYRQFGFPHSYEGKLLKALNQGVPRMAVMPNGIRVILMRRDAEEIRQSYQAFFGQQLKNAEHIDRNMDDVTERIHNRRDVLSLHTFQYRQVVDGPLGAFTTLAENDWPIDSAAAAATIDPELCRFRIEELVLGIV